MGKKHGFSFSWRRARGLSGLKGKVSKATGIPLTRSGRRRKVGRMMGCSVIPVAFLFSLSVASVPRFVVRCRLEGPCEHAGGADDRRQHLSEGNARVCHRSPLIRPVRWAQAAVRSIR
jgi:hypothetical protein